MATGTTTNFVVLLRISTAKTGGIDSNGIAAQRRDINLFLQHYGSGSNLGLTIKASLQELQMQ